MQYIFRLFLGGILLSTVACEQVSLDVQAPSLQFMELTPSPGQSLICGAMEDSVFQLRSGELFTFEVQLRDDAALSQYKIDIHNNFDCHGHGDGATPGFSSPDISNQTEDWSLLEITTLSGTQQIVRRELMVPEQVTAGTYHFQLRVVDEVGNDIPLGYIYSLKVLNSADTIAPTLELSMPTGNININRGEELHFTGELHDNRALDAGGNGLVFLTYTDLNSGNTFTSSSIFPVPAGTSTSYPFDFNFTIPSTLPTGNYRFSVRAQDGVRNIAEAVEFEVKVNG